MWNILGHCGTPLLPYRDEIWRPDKWTKWIQVAHLDLLVICLRLCALVRIAPPLPRTQEALLAQLERPQTSQRTHGIVWILVGFKHQLLDFHGISR